MILQKKLRGKNLILASMSPRRQELLKGLDIPFRTQKIAVDEIYPEHLQKENITKYLALLKADSFQGLTPKSILITADTIVWSDNKTVMKPKDKKEAICILENLSGRPHKVFTSVCLRSTDKTIVFSDTTKVYFKALTNEEINYYIENYQVYDKAGGYGAQDWIGYIGIEKLEGSYFNVMGLPVHKLYRELARF